MKVKAIGAIFLLGIALFLLVARHGESVKNVQFPVISYPNPFDIKNNKIVNIKFNPDDNEIVTIVNLLGQPVATLPAASVSSYFGKATWDGLDDWGTAVASGIYFILVRGRNVNDRGKMTVIN